MEAQTKTKKYLMYAGIAAAIIVLLVIISNAAKAAKDKKDKNNSDQEVLENSEIISGGGQPGVFLVRPYTDKIWNDLQSWNPDPDIYDELLDLTDENLRAIWTDWNKRYRAEYKNRPLRDAIESGYYFSAYTWAWKYHTKLFVDKLKAIGLP